LSADPISSWYASRKEFDPEIALEVAVKVFWRLGYERTSTIS
jgi:hypothetical protein